MQRHFSCLLVLWSYRHHSQSLLFVYIASVWLSETDRATGECSRAEEKVSREVQQYMYSVGYSLSANEGCS